MRFYRATIVIALILMTLLAGCGNPQTQIVMHDLSQIPPSLEFAAKDTTSGPLTQAAGNLEGT